MIKIILYKLGLLGEIKKKKKPFIIEPRKKIRNQKNKE